MLNILLLFAGFAMLIYGADVFVAASSKIAVRLGIPGVVVGLTIVAMGTSAPEAVISVLAAVRGSNELAVGNVVGSNMFNLLFIIGVCGLLRPFTVSVKGVSRDLWMCAVSTAALLGIAYSGGQYIMRATSVLFLLAFATYMAVVVIDGLRNKGEQSLPLEAENQVGPGKLILGLLLGFVLIISGGHFSVMSATNIAQAMRISERIIGITVVGAGTSLPELVTSVVACRKGKSDIALGNIVGSNIFNILLVLGLSGAISPIPISSNLRYDLLVLMVSSTLALIFIVSKQRVSRTESAILLTGYVGYMASLVGLLSSGQQKF